MDKSYYELLGVPKSADPRALKKAFHRLSKALHPDTTLLPEDEAAKKFRNVYEAYELLSDPLKRKVYDKELQKRLLDPQTSYTEGKKTFKTSFPKTYLVDSRRPFSGGELFSLLLLFIALAISLLLAIGFAFIDGREFQVKPSWLAIDQTCNVVPLLRSKHVNTPFSKNTIEPTFFTGN